MYIPKQVQMFGLRDMVQISSGNSDPGVGICCANPVREFDARKKR